MSIAELHKLPSIEKLKIIEALWNDIALDDASFDSPAWHEAQLRTAESDRIAGRNELMDWEEAKQQLRKQFE